MGNSISSGKLGSAGVVGWSLDKEVNGLVRRYRNKNIGFALQAELAEKLGQSRVHGSSSLFAKCGSTRRGGPAQMVVFLPGGQTRLQESSSHPFTAP